MLQNLGEPITNMTIRTLKANANLLRAIAALVLGIVLLPTNSLLAQSETHSINEYWRPGYPTITINVMGNVDQSGLWKIERDLDFIELASVLNIARFESGREKVITTVRIYRGPSSSRALVYEAELVDILESVAPYPRLNDADLLVVEQKTKGNGVTLRTVTSTIAAIGSVILITLRILDRT